MPPNKPIRIVIDTNLLISAVIGKTVKRQFDELLLYYQAGIVIFCSCNELIEEFLEVSARPKILKYISQTQSKKFITLFHKIAHHYKLKNFVEYNDDIDDRFLLSLSVTAKADYLVCGDKQLLKLGRFEKTIIVNLSDLLQIISKK